MPNAKDATGIQNHRFLILGPTGSGKTSQILTLPGRKFIYLFDPNALLSLRGNDVEYEQFLPTQLSMDVRSLSRDNKKSDKLMATKGSEVYLDWEKDFESKIDSGFFDNFDVIGLDSCTTFLDLIMDRILTINGRPGQFPGQDDYPPQMVAFTNVMRTLNGLGKMIYVTGHLKTDQHELTKKILRQPMMTGQLREKIPLLFSDVLVTSAENDGKGNISYTIQTVADREVIARTSIKGLNPVEDVTLDWSKPLDNQGLGGLLRWEEKNRKG